MLSRSEKDQFSRHLAIEGFGEKEQDKLKHANVLVIGAGGLGSPVLLYLAASGIGNIGIVEFDKVEFSNLNRQIIYSGEDIGKSKAQLASATIKQKNAACKINVFEEKWENKERARTIASAYDILVDCTDNYTSRLLTDTISSDLGKPFVYGAIYGLEGQVSVFNYKGSKRYTEYLTEIPEEKDKPVGVLGALPGVIGSIQAAEVVKLITGIGEVLTGKLLVVSLKYNRYQVLEL